VNLFTEDHAALTGAREIIIANNLKPEQSKCQFELYQENKF
jgi:outer membrane receptor for ferrienterochelin and colicins